MKPQMDNWLLGGSGQQQTLNLIEVSTTEVQSPGNDSSYKEEQMKGVEKYTEAKTQVQDKCLWSRQKDCDQNNTRELILNQETAKGKVTPATGECYC